MKWIECMFLGLILLNVEVSFAQYGTLDTTFDGDGKVLTTFDNYDSAVHSLILQPDGKIIAAGTVFDHANYSQFGLVRYHTNGSLDTTFGTGGRVVSSFANLKMSLNSIVLQPNGKIIGAGIIYNNYIDSQFVLVRYNNNGTLDTSFGVGGLIIKDSVNIKSLIRQTDGKIIAAGFSFDEFNRDFKLIRYNEDGTLDNNFGLNGIVTTSIGDKDLGYDVALQSDGKIVLSGNSHNDSGDYDSDFVVIRYESNGSLDATFGVGGKVIMDVGAVDEARAIKIQTDGKIIFTGWSGPPYVFKMIRLLSNGDLDSDFGTNGTAVTNISISDSEESIEIQPDGKIVIAGSFPNTGGNDIAVGRYEINGDFDTTFGNNGCVFTSFITTSKINAIVLQSDGKILAGGEAGVTQGSYSPDFALLRYTSGLVLENAEFNSEKNTFLAYPNPVDQSINLNFNLDHSELLFIDLYDSNGRLISNLLKKTNFEAGYITQKLELPETLSKGVYFLNISNGTTISNIKIVK